MKDKIINILTIVKVLLLLVVFPSVFAIGLFLYFIGDKNNQLSLISEVVIAFFVVIGVWIMNGCFWIWLQLNPFD